MKQILLLLLVPLLSFGQWTQIGADIDGEAAEDNSGWSVSLSSDGTVLAVGAIENQGNGVSSGHVRVYENLAGVWTQIGADIDGEDVGDYSGWSVSLSSDGNILAVGAYFNDGNGTLSGHVRVFENLAGVWTQIGSDIDGEAAGDLSGASVSLSSDGSILAIGAYTNDGNGADSGHVRVFENLAGVWTQIGADIEGEGADDYSGWSVSLNDNGNIVAIGALGNDGNGTDSGHVRVFENIAGVWTQIGADIDGEAAGDRSGVSVSLNGDGNILAIGADYNDGNGSNSGHVRVFENIAGVWIQIGVDIDGEAAGDFTGYSVSLNGNGNILAIGEYFNDGNGSNSGRVRVFENLAGLWTQIDGDINGEASGDFSGISVNLNSSGNVLAIGAAYNDENGNDSGHVRVYNNSSLGVNSHDFGLQFKVYPNPCFGSTNIELESIHQETKISIFDLLGKELMLTTYNNTDKIILDIKQYKTGVYIMKIIAGTNIASFRLVVK